MSAHDKEAPSAQMARVALCLTHLAFLIEFRHLLKHCLLLLLVRIQHLHMQACWN